MAHRRVGLFAVPALVLFSAVVIVPVLYNAFFSVTDWNGVSAHFRFIGLGNFGQLLHDQSVRQALRNTLLFTLVNSPVQVGLGLVLALCITGPGRLRTAARVLFVMPIAISGAAIGLLGQLIFSPENSLASSLQRLSFLSWLPKDWTGSPHLALAAVILMNLWQWSGFSMLIFMAGLVSIPPDYYEAAIIDGSSRWQRFQYVTWPFLAPVTTVNVVVTLIGGLKIFDIIYVLTNGGPDNATESIVMLITNQIGFNRFGYSAAMSLSLTVVVLLISALLLGFLRRREARL